ncbi:MAG: L,D-transpeptidase family protein [Phycisphaerae bacterium]|nr:L,D-transpeptidase family protein [Phycisphaerae bacterium]
MAKIYTGPRKRRHPFRTLGLLAGAVGVIAFVAVWWSSEDEAAVTSAEGEGGASVDSGGQIIREVRPARPDDPMECGTRGASGEAESDGDRARRVAQAAQAGSEALQKDDVLAAQAKMSAALRAGATGDQAAELRAKLVQLANKVTLSPGRATGDPRTATYIVQKGDNLRKIAKEFKITDDLIAKMNNLSSKSMIRQGARLKVARGPFNAVVYKREHTLDVFLDDVLVRSYKVGLGEHDSTPTGTWRVKNKLKNPTYYPPRGGKIVHAEDPNNPLGEHWIGLEGVAGEAKGQERYGIHGTNEPDSIGKNASLGCVRMHNEDVAELYTLLVEGDSQVGVKE